MSGPLFWGILIHEDRGPDFLKKLQRMSKLIKKILVSGNLEKTIIIIRIKFFF